jgi:threonine/homoserine/homoserine lactone efflux protein
MMYYVFFGITYGFAAASQPGPFQSYLISQTLSRGWRYTLPIAFVPLLSDVAEEYFSFILHTML